MCKRSKVVKAAMAAAVLAGAGSAQAAQVGQWIGDNYTTGGNWNDSSGNGNTGTVLGTVTTTDNVFNGHRAVNFAGATGPAATGFFTVLNTGPANGPLGATGLTLVAVTKTSTANASTGGQFWQKAGLIGNEQGGAVADWGLSYGPDIPAAGVGGPDTTIVGSPLNDGATHVIIQTWDTTGILTLYVDGAQVAQQATTATAPRTANAFPSYALGANLSAQNGDLKVFNGQIAELRIYNDNTQNIAALTASLRGTYVPEPASLGLLGIGALGLLARRRRARA